GAGVVGEAVAQGEETPLAVERDRDLVDLLARVIGRAQVLLAVLDPAHGPSEPERTEGDEEVLGIELATGAEAAADVELDEADPLFGPAQQPGEDAQARRRG